MVFVKVRETYDLHTTKNKMTVIAVHTPDPKIIKANFPGLLMQCKTYRPYSCDVRVACASMMPLDPLGVGTSEGDVAPEDMFNPILYSALSNMGMSQLESRINALASGNAAGLTRDIEGVSAAVDVDTLTSADDEFPIYYGLLSNAHGWKHANPQSGLSLSGLRPLVYEILYNIGDNQMHYPGADDESYSYVGSNASIRGNGKPLPMMNCTSYSSDVSRNPFVSSSAETSDLPHNHELTVPWINCVVAGIIVPPSRLHELFYRMVIEWTIEFSSIRPISELTSLSGLSVLAPITHYQNYDYSSTKAALTGDSSTILSSDSSMVSANVDVQKVM